MNIINKNIKITKIITMIQSKNNRFLMVVIIMMLGNITLFSMEQSSSLGKRKERNSQLDRDFFDAVCEENIDKMNSCIALGANVNYINDDNHSSFSQCSALHVATSFRNLQLVNALLAVNKTVPDALDINIENEQGRTSLERVILRLESEDGTSSHVLTPLGVRRHSFSRIAQALIKAGADVQIETSDGMSLLHKAVCLGDTKIVRSLVLEGEADIEELDGGQTPLEMAIMWNEVYDDQTNIHEENHYGVDSDMVDTLIECGANVNAKDYLSLALDEYYRDKDIEIVETLVTSGFDLRKKDYLSAAINKYYENEDDNEDDEDALELLNVLVASDTLPTENVLFQRNILLDKELKDGGLNPQELNLKYLLDRSINPGLK